LKQGSVRKRGCDHGHAPSLAHAECCRDTLAVEGFLNGHFVRLLFTENAGKANVMGVTRLPIVSMTPYPTMRVPGSMPIMRTFILLLNNASPNAQAVYQSDEALTNDSRL